VHSPTQFGVGDDYFEVGSKNVMTIKEAIKLTSAQLDTTSKGLMELACAFRLGSGRERS